MIVKILSHFFQLLQTVTFLYLSFENWLGLLIFKDQKNFNEIDRTDLSITSFINNFLENNILVDFFRYPLNWH